MRSIEEINGILQTWPEGFRSIFGRKIGKKELLQYLENLKKEKELESMENQFSTMRPLEIDLVIESLKKHDFSSIGK